MDLSSPSRFLPIRPLGRGHIGTVFLVSSSCRAGGHRPYATKVMSKEQLRRTGLSRRAETERRVLSLLDHPFLPTLHSHFESEEQVFFVTDFCPGQDLNVLRLRQPLQKFSLEATRFYAAEVILALEHLHKLRIIYRDLKPENILIQESGHLMITDFDLSLIVETPLVDNDKTWRGLGSLKNMFSCINLKSQSRRKQETPSLIFLGSNGKSGSGYARGKKQETLNLDALQRKGNNGFKVKFPSRVWPVEPKPRKSSFSTCRSHSLVGTEEYIAPEVLWGNGHGFSVDWWTLGILLYEMVYGKTPFKGPNRKETFVNILSKEPELPDVSSPVNDLIQKLLVKEPDMRLGSSNGAEEIKKHKFFHGMEWKHLKDVTSPPFVPPPFVVQDSGKDEVQKQGSEEDPCSSQKQSSRKPIKIQKGEEVRKTPKDLKSKDSSNQCSKDLGLDNSVTRTLNEMKKLEVQDCNSCAENLPASQPQGWNGEPVQAWGDNIGCKKDLPSFRESHILNAAKEGTSVCGRSGTQQPFSVF